MTYHCVVRSIPVISSDAGASHPRAVVPLARATAGLCTQQLLGRGGGTWGSQGDVRQPARVDLRQRGGAIEGQQEVATDWAWKRRPAGGIICASTSFDILHIHSSSQIATLCRTQCKERKNVRISEWYEAMVEYFPKINIVDKFQLFGSHKHNNSSEQFVTDSRCPWAYLCFSVFNKVLQRMKVHEHHLKLSITCRASFLWYFLILCHLNSISLSYNKMLGSFDFSQMLVIPFFRI